MDFSDLAKLSTKVLPTATTLSSRHSLLTSSAECGSYNGREVKVVKSVAAK